MYTVEVYKQDRRMKAGERLVRKVDHSTADRSVVEFVYSKNYPASRGYRYEIHETYVTHKNLMTGKEYQERYDTPYTASASSETFWSA